MNYSRKSVGGSGTGWPWRGVFGIVPVSRKLKKYRSRVSGCTGLFSVGRPQRTNVPSLFVESVRDIALRISAATDVQSGNFRIFVNICKPKVVHVCFVDIGTCTTK